MTIGRISYFFEHAYGVQTYTFAYVERLGNPQVDSESGIWYIVLPSVSSTSLNPVVHVPACTLKGLLVTTVDPDIILLSSS